MRIITGEYKGRRLLSPEGEAIRPTYGKVREAMFSILGYRVEGAVCVDLFAGSGSLGLEALSRGARRCYFADNAAAALALVRKNIELCRAGDKSVVLAGDYRLVLPRIPAPVDIFFLDPPYQEGLYEDCLCRIREHQLLAPDGVILCEHATAIAMPDALGGFEKSKERKYGSMSLSLYGYGEGA